MYEEGLKHKRRETKATMGQPSMLFELQNYFLREEGTNTLETLCNMNKTHQMSFVLHNELDVL